jgi:predicted metal-binding protein
MVLFASRYLGCTHYKRNMQVEHPAYLADRKASILMEMEQVYQQHGSTRALLIQPSRYNRCGHCRRCVQMMLTN